MSNVKPTKRTLPDPIFKRQLHAVYGSDLEAASIGLGVSVKTLKRYLTQYCNNEPLRKLLYIQFRGYLPDIKEWDMWRISEQGLHSPDGKIYTPNTLNAWNLEKSEHLFNRWFIQDMKELNIYRAVRRRIDDHHRRPACVIAPINDQTTNHWKHWKKA